MHVIVVAGPAGSGKSTFTKSFADWIEQRGLSTWIVNFDPAAEYVPYTPNTDVREYVRASDIEIKYGLGPNGALVTSIDLLVNHVYEIRAEIEDAGADYVLVDLPGQLEVVAFRRTGPILIKELLRGLRASMVFLVDFWLTTDRDSALSILLLAMSAQYRFGLPQVLALNKADIVAEAIKDGFFDEEILKERSFAMKLLDERFTCTSKEIATPYTPLEVTQSLCEAIKATYEGITPISSRLGIGFDNVFAELQRIFVGGEDYEVR